MYQKIILWTAAVLLLSFTGGAFAQAGPQGWWSETIGTGAQGNATIEGDTYLVTGNGNDIWDAADAFHYLYKQLEGDGSMTARVVSHGTGSNTWAKGGIMIRQNNTPGSADAYMVITDNQGGDAGNGAGFQWRDTQGGGAAWADAGAATVVDPPQWIRLERQGNSFSGYYSADGQAWTQCQSSHTVIMTDPVLIGLCVTSHAAGELRTYEFDNVSWTGNVTDKAPQLRAWQPDPADGTVGADIPLFRWSAGETALFHKVYFGTTPELTEADLKVPQQFHTIYYHAPGLEPGVTYYWRVDEIEADGTMHIGDVWSVTGTPLAAYAPQPADGATGQLPGLVLGWTPGTMAMSHQVYFGMDQAAVAAGDTSVDQGTVDVAEFNTDVLRASTTYYWRIDEIKLDTVEAGEVWSFTTADGITNKILYEVWESIGGDNLSALTGHADYPNNPTTSEYVDSFQSPVDWADNYGQRLMGWLKPPQTGDYTFWIAGDNEQQLWLSSDGSPTNALQIANVPGWTPALDWDNTGGGTGNADAQESDPIALQAGQKYFIMALGKEGTGGDSTAVAWQGPGIDTREVIKGEYVDMFALPPLQAFSPYPADGAVDTPQELVLEWNAGEGAQQHEVYFGDDAEAIATADTSSPLFMGSQNGTTFDAGSLEWGKTFSWRVDEISGAEVIRGSVWSFTTATFISVDDFEGYTDDMDAGEAIWQTWVDGLTNLTGSIVGYFDAPFAERTTVHGGRQSMPFDYNNIVSPYYSELELPLDGAQDWTVEGVDTLSLWFHGYPVSFAETADGITMSGAGHDIWDTADDFRFAYKQLNGDGVISARVNSIGNTDGWAKGGVMIRESLDPGAKFAYVVVTPAQGVSFGWRALAGTAPASVTQAGLEAPHAVRLTRSGDVFTAQYSADGNVWTDLAQADGTPVSVSMFGSALIGLCVTSHNSNLVTTAEFSDIAITGAGGPWQIAEIGDDPQPGNSPDDLYVGIQDSSNKSAFVVHPDPAAVNVTDWTQWNISLSSFGAVNLGRVNKLYIGVGDRDNPTPGGAGRIFVDDIRVTRPEPEPAE